MGQGREEERERMRARVGAWKVNSAGLVADSSLVKSDIF